MVKIYSTTSCPWCKKAKGYLDSKGVSYENINLDVNMEARGEFLKLNPSGGVPTLDIDGKIVIGFDKDKIDEYLKL